MTHTDWHPFLDHCVQFSLVVVIPFVYAFMLALLVDAVNLSQHWRREDNVSTTQKDVSHVNDVPRCLTLESLFCQFFKLLQADSLDRRHLVQLKAGNVLSLDVISTPFLITTELHLSFGLALASWVIFGAFSAKNGIKGKIPLCPFY